MKLYKLKQRFKRVWRDLFPKPKNVTPTQSPGNIYPKRPYKKRFRPKVIRKCPTVNKFMFTESQAKYKRAELLRNGTSSYLRVYKCQFCGFWHLTHKKNYLGK